MLRMITILFYASLLIFFVRGAEVLDEQTRASNGDQNEKIIVSSPIEISSIVSPQPYGYWIGDIVSFSYIFRVQQPDIKLDFSRVPRADQEYGEFEIRSFTVQRQDYQDGAYEVRLDFAAQIFAVRDMPQYVDFRIEVFWSEGMDLSPKTLEVPAIKILVSPLSLSSETAADEPYNLEPFSESRWILIGVFGVSGISAILLSILMFGRIIVQERRRQKLSSLAVGRSLLEKHIKESGEAQEGIRIFRETIWKKFSVSPTSTSVELGEAISAKAYWRSWADKIAAIWQETDQVLFAGVKQRKDLVGNLFALIRQLERRERDEI